MPENAAIAAREILTGLHEIMAARGSAQNKLDRVVMLMADRPSLRDTIAFPKTTSAACPMDGSPAAVDDETLRELHVRRLE